MAKVHRLSDVTVVELSGQFDSLNEERSAAVRGLLLGLAGAVEPPQMLLDLTDTTFIGSSFLATVFHAHKRLMERNGRLAVCGLSPFCRQVMHSAAMDQLWPCLADRDAALASLAELK